MKTDSYERLKKYVGRTCRMKDTSGCCEGLLGDLIVSDVQCNYRGEYVFRVKNNTWATEKIMRDVFVYDRYGNESVRQEYSVIPLARQIGWLVDPKELDLMIES